MVCKSQICSERDFVRALVNIHTCYGFRGNPARLRIAMLTAYLDESGTHERKGLCVVAGYIGNDAQWSAFAADWIPALQRPHRNLHMRNFKWKHPKAAEILTRLGPIPDRYNLQRVIGGLWMSDYRAIVEGKLRKKFTTPFMWSAQLCIAVTMNHISKDDEILFVFDRNEGSESAFEILRNHVFATNEPRIKDIVLMSQKQTVCLDPADFLAFQVREFKTFGNSYKAKLGMSILGDGNVIGHIYTADELRKGVEFMIDKGVVPGKMPKRPPKSLPLKRVQPRIINLLR